MRRLLPFLLALYAGPALALTSGAADNGARLLAVESASSDHFACLVAIRCEPTGRVEASMVRRLLLESTLAAHEGETLAESVARLERLNLEGVRIVAQVNDDHLLLAVTGPSPAWDDAVALLADAVERPSFAPEAVEGARARIGALPPEEPRHGPFVGMLASARQVLFPERAPTELVALEDVTADMLVAERAAVFTGPRAVAVAVGPLPEASMLAGASLAVDELPAESGSPTGTIQAPADAPDGARAEVLHLLGLDGPPSLGPLPYRSSVTESGDTPLAIVVLAYAVPNYATEGSESVDLVRELLAGPEGRLMRNARLRSVANASGAIALSGAEQSHLVVFAATQAPWRVAELRTELADCVAQLGGPLVPAHELDAARRRRLGASARELETPLGRAHDLARCLLSGVDPAPRAADPLATLRALTDEDVRVFGERYLREDEAALAVTLPIITRDARRAELADAYGR